MKHPEFIFIGADTSRTKSYLQAFKHFGIKPIKIGIYGINIPKDGKKSTLKTEKDYLPQALDETLFYPDLDQNIEDILSSADVDLVKFNCTSINDREISDFVMNFKHTLLIFSGFGGEIVNKSLCDNFSILHAHSGKLPEYKGSTTLYYSWLQEKKITVSVILLSDILDAGQVISETDYSIPDRMQNIDHDYDGAARAISMSKTILNWTKLKPNMKLQSDDQRIEQKYNYFIIHPVLKNLLIARDIQKKNTLKSVVE